MFIMRLILGNLLLFLALGPCFESTDAQETTETDVNITTTSPNKNTVEPISSVDTPTATSDNTATILAAEVNTQLSTESSVVYEISTMPEEATSGSTPPPSTEIEQTSLKSVPETTPVQTEQTTVTTHINVETTVTEQITLGAPSTVQDETTVVFTSPEVTTPTERSTVEIPAAETTDSAETLSPTSILTTTPASQTESTSIMPVLDPMDTTTETSTTTTSTSTTQFPQNAADNTEPESVSTHFTTPVSKRTEESSTMPSQSPKNLLLIIIVFVAVIFVVCVGMILFTQRRKKNASRNFSPMYMNGSKRSKKKKGADDNAWAGPVKMEAGLECDALVQEGDLPNNGKQDGDDMVLSTFAALDAGDESNGGVGGDGTKEAKKWEEQEPMLYIDEDVKEDTTGTTPEQSEGLKGDEKSKEKGMNGGETFCLTTAV